MPTVSSRADYSRYPVFWIAACFAGGIGIVGLVSIDLATSLGLAATFGVLAAISGRLSYATVFVGLAFIAVGAALYQVESHNVRPDRIKLLYDSGSIPTGSPVEVEGVLLGQPERLVDGSFLSMQVDRLTYRGQMQTVSGNVRLFVPAPIDPDESPSTDLKYGSRIRVACGLERDDRFLNPGVQRTPDVLDRMGIDATATVKSALLIEHLSDDSVFLPLAWVYNQRGRLIDELSTHLDQKTAGVMIASLLGNKYFLDKDTADLFREGGTFHILVISGLHVTFFGGLLLLLLRQFTRNRWIQFVVTSVALWSYALAVGAHVPVVRAATMFTIVLFSYAIYRTSSMLNSLGICALILLVGRPSDLFDPSFQLTFVSVVGIVALGYPLVDTMRRIGSWAPTRTEPFPPEVPRWLRRCGETLYWNPRGWEIVSKQNVWSARLFKSPYRPAFAADLFRKLARFLFEAVAISFVIQVCMLPLTVIYFHRVPLASVLLNLWVGLFIALESFAAVAGALLLHIAAGLAAPFFVIADGINWVLLLLPRMFSSLSWTSFRIPAYVGDGRLIYIAYFLPVLVLALAANRWRPFLPGHVDRIANRKMVATFGASLAILAAIVIGHPFSAPRPDGRLHIDFLDVGQGDSALVTFPDGETLLIDGGGRPSFRNTASRDDDEEPFTPDTRDIGEAVVCEVLWYKGYSHIDHILATHGDADHIQGLTDVAKNFSIDSAFFGRTPPDNANYVELAGVLRQRGVVSETVVRGNIMNFGNTPVEVLYPTDGDVNGPSDNDHSVVLRITDGTRAFLMTGDIEHPAEAEILINGGTVAADIIKVPHHGSHTSSTQAFVDAVHPAYAVISVGRTSPFGHPHKDVVDRWVAEGSQVMTTGARGMISASTDGNDLTVQTYIP